MHHSGAQFHRNTTFKYQQIKMWQVDKYNFQEVLVIIKKANQNNPQNIGENNTNTSGYRDYPMKLQQFQIINLVLSSESKCIHMHKPYHRHTIKKENKYLKNVKQRNNIKHHKRIILAHLQWQM